MTNCPDCGTELSAGLRVCRQCGYRIDTSTVVVSPLVDEGFEACATDHRAVSVEPLRRMLQLVRPSR